MKHLEKLLDRIIDRANVNLREPSFDVGPYVRGMIPWEKFVKYYGFYGLTLRHPLHFHFRNSSLAGSYFLGKCIVDNSLLYKSDIRGDELKSCGDIFRYQGLDIPLHDDEVIRIRDSFLVKNLVHNHSHDPENPEEFLIQNTVSLQYANIHGANVEGSFLGPFATVDITTVHDCVIGKYAYVHTGEVAHQYVEDGQIWIRAGNAFNFNFHFHPEDLRRYVDLVPGEDPTGIFMDFIQARKRDFISAFESVDSKHSIEVPEGASISRYAVIKGKTSISENVLVAQRAFLENAWLGKGSNAQENCYIINSRLEGFNITAHGGKVIHAKLGKKVFVGFNAFLQGKEDCPLVIGRASIVMPHTIIDLEEPLEIPAGHLIWGYIRNKKDLDLHSISLEELSRTAGEIVVGAMIFQGNGKDFVQAFRDRIRHILEANGAYYSRAKNNPGHAQTAQNISFNIIQPYSEGDLAGFYPTIDIRP